MMLLEAVDSPASWVCACKDTAYDIQEKEDHHTGNEPLQGKVSWEFMPIPSALDSHIPKV